MSMLQGFRDGYRVNWKRVFCFTWVVLVVLGIFAFGAAVGGKAFLIVVVLTGILFVTIWAVEQL